MKISKLQYQIIISLLFMISMVSFITIDVFAVNVNYGSKSNTNFDIWGMDGNSRIKTTYNDNGYTTTLRVNGSDYSVKGLSSATYQDIYIQTTLTPISNGSYLQIKYTVRNNGATAKTIGIATDSDIMIGSNDTAPIQTTDRGFTMTGSGYTFQFLGRNSYGVSPNIDSYWFGKYNERTTNRWSQINSTSLSGVDSGMSFAWKDKVIQPNETQEYSALIGVGDLTAPPTLNITSSLKNSYYFNEVVAITGNVNDIDTNDVVKIKWAIDGGTENTIPGTFIPNGVAKNFSLNFSIPMNISVGQHRLDIWAVDSKNNMSTSKNLTFNVSADNINPTANHTLNPSNTWSKQVVISINANDPQTGIKSIQLPNNTVVNNDARSLTMSTNYTVANNGTYIFKISDRAGNVINYNVTVSNIDNTPPILNIEYDTNYTKDDIEIKVISNDEAVGLKEIVLPNNNTVTSSEVYYTVSGNGTYVFKAIDKLGNEITKSIVINNIDKISPILDSTTNINPNKQEAVITITMSDNLSGIDYLVMPNGDKIENKTQHELTINNNGIYLFLLYDKVGNMTKHIVEIFELETNIVPSEIDKIEYKLSGATTKDWTEYTGAFYVTDEGITNITARSYDKAGNLSDETTSIVRIDKTKPIDNGILIELR